MKQFNTSIWLAGFLASSLAVIPMACGPVQEDEAQPVLDDPQLAEQVQESPGGSLGSRLGRPVALGTTVGKTDDLIRPCEGSPVATPDMTYTWTAPFTGRFTFSTQGSALDTVLLVRDASNANVLVGCNDEAFSRSGWSRLEGLNLTAGTLYNITVEAWREGGTGTFQLNISSPDRTSTQCGTCDAPPNTCYQWDNTCVEGACGYVPKALNSPCDDGNFCTVNEICDGQGTCGGGAGRTCDTPGTCEQAAGASCSNNKCNYQPKPAGSSCTDGDACTTGDTCNGAGVCGSSPVTCNPPNTQCYESAILCHPATGCDQPKPLPNGTPCNDGITCTANDVCNGAGTCSGTVQCNINGACVANGTTNPSNPCQACDTAQSTTTWSNKSAGIACNDGNSCSTNDVCNGAGVCAGSAACSINGTCYPAGQRNGSNPCLVCDPARSTTSWSTNDGYIAGTGVCRHGSCASGACYGSGCNYNSDCWQACVGSRAVCGAAGGVEDL